MHRSAITDRELMRQVQADDSAAFAELYDRFAVRAMSVAHGLCRDSTLAADSVQDAFLSVWRGRARYTPELGEVHSWILGIVRNRAIDVLRRNARHAQQTDLGTVPELPGPDDTHATLTAREDATHLRTRLASLPLAQREVIALAYLGELSHTEIADRLRVPLGTVKSRIRLGLIALRTQIAAGTGPQDAT